MHALVEQHLGKVAVVDELLGKDNPSEEGKRGDGRTGHLYSIAIDSIILGSGDDVEHAGVRPHHPQKKDGNTCKVDGEDNGSGISPSATLRIRSLRGDYQLG